MKSRFTLNFTPIHTLKLLQYISRDKQVKVKSMLDNNPALLLERTTISRGYHRLENITAFQLALWELNPLMWELIASYLPREEANRQYAELRDHFDFCFIKEAYQRYFEYFELADWSNFTVPTPEYDALNQLWHQIDRAQSVLPVHIACVMNPASQNFPKYGLLGHRNHALKFDLEYIRIIEHTLVTAFNNLALQPNDIVATISRERSKSF